MSTPRIKSVPNLVRKEALVALIAVAVVCLLSALVEAPLQGPADAEGLASFDVKAPWIFVGIQQILKFLPPLLAGVLLPVAAMLVLAAIPFLPVRATLRWVIFIGVALAAVALTIWGYLS